MAGVGVLAEQGDEGAERAEEGEADRARCRSCRRPAPAAPGSRARSRSSRAAGSSRTSQAQVVGAHPRSSLSVVDVERQLAAEDRDDQAEPDDDLAGGDDHHDQGEDLALLVADHAAEGDQGEVAGVQHQLEAEQDHERAAADEDADRRRSRTAARERTMYHSMFTAATSRPSGTLGRRARPRGPTSQRPDSPSQARLPARTRADGGEQQKDEASKGSRKFSSRRRPIAAGSPKPAGRRGRRCRARSGRRRGRRSRARRRGRRRAAEPGSAGLGSAPRAGSSPPPT